MKKYRKTITIIIILVVALMMFATFFGVYRQDENGKKVNILPDFRLGMEFGDTRVITASINQGTIKTIYDAEGNVVQEEEGVEYTEEAGYKIVEKKINDDSLKNFENYSKSKEIIEQRLKQNNISQYFIDMDKETGTLKIEIPENRTSDDTQNIIKNTGNFMLLDGETFETVFESSSLKKADVLYSQGDTETGVFLQLEFNEEGTKKLQELNNIYIETTEEQTNETGEVENVTNSKVVGVILNDAFIGATILPNIMYNNKIMLTFGVSNNNEELQIAVENAEKEAILLNSGKIPLVYEYSNETVKTNISAKIMLIFLGAIGIVFVIAYIYLIIKYKAKGFISIYFQIGFLGMLLLVLKLTNVVLTIEGIAGIVVSMVLEYVFTYIVLNNIIKEKTEMYKKSNLQFFLNTIPIYAISVIFTFAKRANISSFGMTIFWGIIIIYIYNFIFPKFIFENLKIGGSNENN